MTTATPIQYRLTQLHWTAPSASRAGTSYLVEGYIDRVAGEPIIRAGRCECPDHTHRRRQCKHMAAAEAGRLGKPHAKAVIVRAPQRVTGPQAVADLYGAA